MATNAAPTIFRPFTNSEKPGNSRLNITCPAVNPAGNRIFSRCSAR